MTMAKLLGMADALAQQKWQSSGLTDEQAEKLRLKGLDADQTKALQPYFERVASLYIPYFSPDGKQTGFYRVRYLQQLPGFAGAVKRPQRFAQPANTINEVYLPPLLKYEWTEVFARNDIKLYITEGELKSASAAARGYPTLGLGGVEMWRASKRGLTLLPTLEEINWKDRDVYIVYDKDAEFNPQVISAELKLAHELINRGAQVHIVNLPSEDGKKTGLDDFLVAKGTEQFEELIKGVPALSESIALNEMNEEVVYIRDPGLVIARSSGQRISADAFVKHAYSTWHYKAQKSAKNGQPIYEEKKTAARWLEWPGRSELVKIAYAPGETQITSDSCWNMWKGWGCEPKKGTTIPWHGLLEYIFRDDRPARKWFEQWCAYPLQHPGTKLFTSAVLWSVHQGTGKTLLGRTLMRIYGENATEIDNSDLKESFNEWATRKQFVLGEEVASSNRRSDSDKLKKLITQEEIRINEKHIAKYTVRDCINYLFTSNHPDAFFLEDTDRRFFIQEIVDLPLPFSFYSTYDVWYKSEGASFLFDHLLAVDLGGFDPHGPAPMTVAKEAMIVDNKSDLASWVHNLKVDPDSLLPPKGDLFTNGELLHLYDSSNSKGTSQNGLGRELKRSGFKQVREGMPIRINGALKKLWVVRNIEKWKNLQPQEYAAHYDANKLGGNF